MNVSSSLSNRLLEIDNRLQQLAEEKELMISRRAYGFRNFENYRIRVMTHCGWDGVINRVR